MQPHSYLYIFFEIKQNIGKEWFPNDEILLKRLKKPPTSRDLVGMFHQQGPQAAAVKSLQVKPEEVVEIVCEA